MNLDIAASVLSKFDKHDILQKEESDELQNHIVNRFRLALDNLDLDAVANFASTTRRVGHLSTRDTSVDSGVLRPDQIDCQVQDPCCGSFNVIFPIIFGDGVQWILKIAANFHAAGFNALAASALVSEARTMIMVKRRTSIPIPEVYAYDASFDNRLHVPFLLMEKMEGVSLYNYWYQRGWSTGRCEHFRARVLKNLAAAMLQLNHFTADSSGAMDIDANGSHRVVSSAKATDWLCWWNRKHPQINATEAEAHAVDETNQNNDISINNEDGEWYERGPFEDPKNFVSHTFDRGCPGQFDEASTQGARKSLRLFIDWAFEHPAQSAGGFVLNHADLDTQNILVDEDGTILGLIDWDGASAVPRAVGCAQYPLWLMRDWSPCGRWYQYDIENGKSTNEHYEEMSPDELARYRELYAQCMESEIADKVGGADKLTSLGTIPKQEADVTRRSVLVRSLEMAANTPELTMAIVGHIYTQIEEVTLQEWEPSELVADDGCAESLYQCADQVFEESAKYEQIEQSLTDSLHKVNDELNELPTSQNIASCVDQSGKEPPAGTNLTGLLSIKANSQIMSRKARLAKGACSLVERGCTRSANALHRCDGNEEPPKTISTALSDKTGRTRIFLSWLQGKLISLIKRLPSQRLVSMRWFSSASTKTEDNTDNPPERVNIALSAKVPVTPCVGDVTGSYIRKVIAETKAKIPELLSDPKVKEQAAKRADKEAKEAEDYQSKLEAYPNYVAAEAVAQKNALEVWNRMAQEVQNCGIPIAQLEPYKMDMAYLIIYALKAAQNREKEAGLVDWVQKVLAKFKVSRGEGQKQKILGSQLSKSIRVEGAGHVHG